MKKMSSPCKLFFIFIFFFSMFSPVSVFGFDHNYKDYAGLLTQYVVKIGTGYNTFSNYTYYVDYEKLVDIDQQQLKKTTQSFYQVSSADFKNFSTKQKLAYLINLYNISILKIIADHYPLKSVRFICPFWKDFFNEKVIIFLGKKISFNQLKYDFIPKYTDSSSYIFLITNGAIGDPPLYPWPVLASAYNEQVSQAFHFFMNFKDRFQKEYLTKEIFASRFFLYNKEIIYQKEGSINDLIKVFPSSHWYSKALFPAIKIQLHYRWDLNDIKNIYESAFKR